MISNRRRSLEKKASEEERRAKEEAEKAESLKDKIDGGAATQPCGRLIVGHVNISSIARMCSWLAIRNIGELSR